MNQRQATSRPLKILIFTPEPAAWASGGGVTRFSQLLLQRLSTNVSADCFVTGRRPGLLGSTFRLLTPLYDAFRLAILLVSKSHDVYHLNPSFEPRSVVRDGLFLVILRLFRRKEVLIFFRGWDTGYFSRIATSSVWRGLFKLVYGRAARFIVLGSPFANDLRALGFREKQVHILTTMFDGRIFDGVVRRHNDSEIQILFLGRFIATKGIYETLEAFQRINIDFKQVHLIMAGDGEEAPKAREWCAVHGLKDQITFPGYVEGAEKAQLLVDSDVFVLPSYHGEGCPNALLEAMGAGLPTIVSPTGGIPDVVKEGVNGLVVASQSVDEIEVALRKLIVNPDLRAAIALRNREESWQKYEASIVTARLEEHYRSLAEETVCRS